MEIQLTDNFKGKCLIAMPNIDDSIFAHSVIYVTEHNSISGAVGVIINKNLPEKKKGLSTNFDFTKYNNQWSQIPLYFGGPVELGSGFVLHQSLRNTSELILTGDRYKIEQLAVQDEVKPWLLTAGYCLWDSFQLEQEVRFNNWLVIEDISTHLLADILPEKRYSEALRMAGINLATLDFNGCGYA